MTQRFSLNFAVGLLLCIPAFSADSIMVVDRGLPQINLNNSSGPVRSNVRWGWYDQGFLGDSFTIGAPGEQWVIDSIRTWTVPGDAKNQPASLGDFYQDVRLYFGQGQADLTPVESGLLSAGTNETSNSNIEISDSAQPLYDDFGANLRIWQVDFRNLNLMVAGGTSYHFGVWGLGRAEAGTGGKTYPWFTHASNAPLSGGTEDGADGVMLLFDGSGRNQGTFNAKGSGWDKSSDINVQVFAHRLNTRTASNQALQ